MAWPMDGLCELIATVPTGLEGGAADEVQKLIGTNAEATRGKISFVISSLEQLQPGSASGIAC